MIIVSQQPLNYPLGLPTTYRRSSEQGLTPYSTSSKTTSLSYPIHIFSYRYEHYKGSHCKKECQHHRWHLSEDPLVWLYCQYIRNLRYQNQLVHCISRMIRIYLSSANLRRRHLPHLSGLLHHLQTHPKHAERSSQTIAVYSPRKVEVLMDASYHGKYLTHNFIQASRLECPFECS